MGRLDINKVVNMFLYSLVNFFCYVIIFLLIKFVIFSFKERKGNKLINIW